MPDDKLTREVRTVSAAGAKVALAAAEKMAVDKGLKVSIAIVDGVGHLVAFQRLDGAALTSIEAAQRKARTAAQLGLPTKVFQDLVDGGTPSLLAFEFVAPSQGGVPLILDEVAVGGIAASGGSREEDEMVASAGASGLLSWPMA